MTAESLVQQLLDYLVINDRPEPADVIFIFGSVLQPAVWEQAASVYRQGLAPVILTTGYAGPSAQALGIESEGKYIAEKLTSLAVPSSAIVIEDKSTNTIENVLFGMDALREKGIEATSAIIVTKPFHSRRCRATFVKQYPDVRVMSCPPALTLEQMIDRPTFNEFAIRVVGEIDRLIRYGGENGSIAPQTIPQTVLDASEQLRGMVA